MHTYAHTHMNPVKGSENNLKSARGFEGYPRQPEFVKAFLRIRIFSQKLLHAHNVDQLLNPLAHRGNFNFRESQHEPQPGNISVSAMFLAYKSTILIF
ncbi:hypothetical protein GDO78_001707 [Eleutherodactylus coqui]|uniref:Uncharacterized protein n=1 Tax=Eleutherodactylus coqui TaxID=57060 RepID=A0A8J6FUJ2_ELECQ|nr:hypothetical protein GDO78_001707 [Eleutherodactylus coqui]